MGIKKISIATITTLALAISSVSFAAGDILSDLERQINGEPSESLATPNNINENASSSLDELEAQLNSLEQSINDEINPDVVISTIEDKELDTGIGAFNNTNEQAAQDVVFLRNIPEGTKITVTQSLNLLPLNKYIIFHNGQRVIESPLYETPNTTFCYMELVESGRSRRISSGREYIVTKNETTSSVLVSKDNPDEKFKVYQSKLYLNHEQIRWLSCYSSYNERDSKAPLSIKDLRLQTNGAFKIEFPAYEEL